MASQLDQETTESAHNSDTFGNLKIEVRLRSKSKAAHNDPEFTIPERELYEKVLAESANEGLHPMAQRMAAHMAVRGPDSDQDESNDDDDESGQDVGHEDFDGEDENRSECDVDFHRKWLEPVDVVVTSANLEEPDNPTVVASCNAKLIRRGQMRGDFYGKMELPNRETASLAVGLFDRYGRLRPEFQTHPVIKGTGVWGEELDEGDILLIERIFVNEGYRRQGLGRKMTEALLARVREKSWSFFALVWPTFLTTDDIERELDSLTNGAAKDRVYDREHNRAVTFYRSLGFRRVGSTIWFAFAPKQSHPSHQLVAAADFNPPEAHLTSLHALLSAFKQNDGPPRSNLDRVRKPEPRQQPDYLAVLKDCMRQKGSADACWMSKDEDGNSVLHLSASLFNVACVEWILNQPFATPLLQLRNNRGETPLELLQFKLEKLRTQKVRSGWGDRYYPVSDEFKGHSHRAVRCLIMLKGLRSVESVVDLQGVDAVQQMVRGCSCGECMKGFLSPRMSYALLCQAEIGFDMMNDDTYHLLGDWVESHDHYLQYLPPGVLQSLKTNKSMPQGFANLWQHVATCLRNGKVPKKANVLDALEDAGEWPPHTKNFLERGGTVESAFLAICGGAMEQDEWKGDGDHEETFSKEISKLPKCRNDHEFGYVSGMCGYQRLSVFESAEPGTDFAKLMDSGDLAKLMDSGDLARLMDLMI